ncbi:hypothetical protein ACTHRK_17215 [Dietzia cercidiphylli]|uniref:hypothetical protein n=1 Tax=Dietzia cercidiphylli TaxID=498199 RepID=UPI003F7D19EB
MTDTAAALGPLFAVDEVLADDGEFATVVTHRIGEGQQCYVAQIHGQELLDFAPVEDVRCRDCQSITAGAAFSGRCLRCHEAAAGPVAYEPEQEDDALALERSLERSGFRFLD